MIQASRTCCSSCSHMPGPLLLSQLRQCLNVASVVTQGSAQGLPRYLCSGQKSMPTLAQFSGGLGVAFRTYSLPTLATVSCTATNITSKLTRRLGGGSLRSGHGRGGFWGFLSSAVACGTACDALARRATRLHSTLRVRRNTNVTPSLLLFAQHFRLPLSSPTIVPTTYKSFRILALVLFKPRSLSPHPPFPSSALVASQHRFQTTSFTKLHHSPLITPAKLTLIVAADTNASHSPSHLPFKLTLTHQSHPHPRHPPPPASRCLAPRPSTRTTGLLRVSSSLSAASASVITAPAPTPNTAGSSRGFFAVTSRPFIFRAESTRTSTWPRAGT